MCSSDLVLRGRFGDKVRLKIIGRAPSRLRLLMGRGAESGGVAALDDLPDALLRALETRTLWARLGL